MNALVAAPPEYLTISFSDEIFNEEAPNRGNALLPFANSNLYHREVTTVRVLANGDDVKTVYDVGIDIKGIAYEYVPGDTIGIFPQNDEDEVIQILTHLGLLDVANKTYSLSVLPNTTKKKAAVPNHVPIKGSLKELFLYNLDIRTVPKKLFLRSLLDYTTQEDELKRLQLMCTPTGSGDYNHFISNEGKTLLNFFKAFPSCKPPIERLLEHLPGLKPRPYSITTSPLANKNEIRFAISVLDEPNTGVCSGWLHRNFTPKKTCLDSKEQNDDLNDTFQSMSITNSFKIQFYFRKGNSFHLPDDTKRAIVMVGPGTGVAPFIGFLDQRTKLRTENSELGPAWLFYGCRYSNRDFLYKDEITKYLNDGALTKLFTAFSRENNNKSYVQHKILENGAELIELLLNNDAIFYVCGDAKSMRQDVKNSVIECLKKFKGMEAKASEDLVLDWQKTNKYIEDIWV